MQLWGIPGVQKEAVLAAERSLVTVERIVDELEPRPGGVVIPGWVHRRGGRGAGRLAAVLRARAYRAATTTSIASGTRSPATASASRRGWRSTSSGSGETADDRRGAALARQALVFIGVGRPSTAAILARMVHNPDLVLVYESGTIGAKPYRIPLSIGDGELAETADAVVSVPEMFNYWIGAGPDPGRVPRRGAGRPSRQPQHAP